MNRGTPIDKAHHLTVEYVNCLVDMAAAMRSGNQERAALALTRMTLCVRDIASLGELRKIEDELNEVLGKINGPRGRRRL